MHIYNFYKNICKKFFKCFWIFVKINFILKSIKFSEVNILTIYSWLIIACKMFLKIFHFLVKSLKFLSMNIVIRDQEK